ncbi:hypothetical protein B0H14DRAFT_3056453, partial [Mycena olivaceomarginata]
AIDSLLYALLAVFQIRLLVVAKFFSEEDETKSKLGCRRNGHFQLLCYPHRRLLPIIRSLIFNRREYARPTRNILRLCAGYLLFATAVASRPHIID